MSGRRARARIQAASIRPRPRKLPRAIPGGTCSNTHTRPAAVPGVRWIVLAATIDLSGGALRWPVNSDRHRRAAPRRAFVDAPHARGCCHSIQYLYTSLHAITLYCHSMLALWAITLGQASCIRVKLQRGGGDGQGCIRRDRGGYNIDYQVGGGGGGLLSQEAVMTE